MKNAVLIIPLIFFAACASPDAIPKDVIAPDKMKFIFWDAMRAGELATLTSPNDTSLAKQKNMQYLQQVFAVHHITKEEFYESYKWYEQHPNFNKILMDSVSAYANRQRANRYNQQPRKSNVKPKPPKEPDPADD
mgnify:CR=1 FL=1